MPLGALRGQGRSALAVNTTAVKGNHITKSFLCYGAPFNLEAEPNLFPSLLKALPPGWEEVPEPRGERTFVVSTEDDGRYRLEIRGKTRELSSFEVVLETLRNKLEFFTAVRSREYVFVHAAACALDGKAVLLPGLSRAGKTTLAQALASRGLTFYSDEYAVLDPDGLLHPFARDLAVRAHPNQARGCRLCPRELGYETADQPAKVVLGCFLQYRSGGPLEVQQISAGEAVLSLFDNTLAARMVPRRSLRLFAQITKSMELYAGVRGEADEAADWIAGLLRESNYF